MQEQMNSMNDSGDFKEMESNYSGRLSHVSSQHAMIPSSRSILSRDKRLSLDTWNSSGLQEKVFGNQFSTFDSSTDHPQRIQSDDVQRELLPRNPSQGIHCAIPRATDLVLEVRRSKTMHTSDDRQNQGTIPMSTFATRPLTMSSTIPMELPQKYMVGQQRQQISELQLEKFPNPQSFSVWKIRFKNQVTTCSDFPSDAMLWIKEVDKVDSIEELKSSRSVCGKDFPNFEMLDAKIVSALNKIIQNSQFKKKVGLEEQKAQKEDRFLRGRQTVYMIYDYFRVTRARDTVLDYADVFSVTLHDDNIQKFDTRWNEVLFIVSKIPSDDILKSLYKLKIRESVQLKIVLELYDMEIHQKMSMPNYQKLTTMVKRSIDQKLRLRNFEVRHGTIEPGAVVKSRKGPIGFEGGKDTCYQWKEKDQCSQGDGCSFRHGTQDSAQKPEHTVATPSEPTASQGRSVSRKRSIRQK